MLDFFTSEELNERLAEPIPYDRPRAITGAAEQINVQSGRDRVDKREASAWQIAAWQFYDAIGELKFAFNLMGQVVSRVRIFAAAVENPNMPPIEATDFIAKSEDAELKKAAEAAHTWVEDFKSRAATSISSLLRESAINMCVPGEFYVLDGYGKDYILHYAADGSFKRLLGGPEGGIVHWGPHGGMIDTTADQTETMLIAMNATTRPRRSLGLHHLGSTTTGIAGGAGQAHLNADVHRGVAEGGAHGGGPQRGLAGVEASAGQRFT